MARQSIPAHVREQQINNLPNITFVRWDGEYGGVFSKAVCRCDADHEWSAGVNHLIYTGSGCPECAGNRRWTASERVEQINNLPNITFVHWLGGYRNGNSKAAYRCDTGHEWSASVSSLLNHGSGCPECYNTKRRIPSDERVEQISTLPNITFVRWDGEYRNVRSKAVCRCDIGHEWSARVDSLINLGTGCPQCAKHGYNPAKPGTLYALRSECGAMVKIGISNDHQRRHRELADTTPFDWSCVELLHGDGALIAGLEKAFHGMTEPAVFATPFDGYTEWRKWDARVPEWFDTWREMT